jgi:hypothetical protein
MVLGAGKNEALSHDEGGNFHCQSIQYPTFRQRRLMDLFRAQLPNQGSCQFNTGLAARSAVFLSNNSSQSTDVIWRQD